MVHSYNLILFNGKRNELSRHKSTWKSLKSIYISERNQYEKAIYHMITTICHSGKDKTMRTLKISVTAKGSEEERRDQ